MSSSKYIQELEEFIAEELLPAYIESKVRNRQDPNQSYIIRKLLNIMKSKKQVPALLRQVIPSKNLS